MSTLRVIAGKARGRRLRTVPGDSTRPITDRAKEALFNILASDIEQASVLDLFAGTGAVGIEALSRGAGFALFIDLQRQAVETVRQNLKTTGFEAEAEVLRMDAFAYLERPVERTFEVIFIAPPQYRELWKKALLCLDAHPGWMAEDAWVIAQIHPVEYQPLELVELREFDQRRYGSVLFVFFERTETHSRLA